MIGKIIRAFSNDWKSLSNDWYGKEMATAATSRGWDYPSIS